MVKKVRHTSKRTPRIHLNEEDVRTERILIENFVALQKVMTHLSEKFDNLAGQISKMLNLFEISAKSLAEKEFNNKEDNRDVKKVVEKLDGLLEQNKTIAKGLLLLHDEVSPNKVSTQRTEFPLSVQRTEAPVFISKPIMARPQSQSFSMPPTQDRYPRTPTPNFPTEKYQKSISSEGEDDFSEGTQPPVSKSLLKE